MMFTKSLFITIVLTVAATACGGSEAATDSPTEQPTTQAADAGETPDQSDPAPADDTGADDTTPVGIAGLDVITISNAMDGNGERPKLAWDEVPGAAEYTVILNTADGGPYWTWSGAEASVWLGGSDEEPNPNSEAPTLFEPLTMYVFAEGAGGEPLGASQPTVISQ